MKKLFISLLTIILTLQLALPVAFAGKLSTSALDTSDADTGGMQYANWYFGQNNLKEVNVVIEMDNDPSTEDGLYFQAYDGYINGQMFYFGLQTRTGKPGYGLTGKGLIFSEFGTTDNTNIKTASGGWYEVGTYEGPFISTRIGYDWTNHKYILTIKYKESNTVGDWYEFWIEDLITNSKTYVGALRFTFPKDLSKKGITDGGGTWTELYYRKVQGSPLPEWSISIVEVSAVSKDGAIIYPKTAHLKNADNFYHIDQAFHTENNRLDFVIGGNATKSFNEKNITLSSGTIKVNAMLNGSLWNGTLNFTLKREKTYKYITVPLNLTDYLIGTYTIQYDSSGPTNATLSSITPSSTQTLTSGSTVTFTMNFTTQKLNLLYVIVLANSSLKSTVQDFVQFKKSQGFDVIVDDVSTIEKNWQGIDRVEKIRNFLKEKTKDYPKSFTLLIGDPYDKNKVNPISTGGDIPMRIIYPWYDKPNNFMIFNYPTDFYYCDLDGNWDKNNDEYYGSSNEDDIKLNVRNFVGRIPFSDSTTINKILTNTITLQTTKLNYTVLLAQSQSGGINENSDTAKWGEEARTNILEPAGFKVTTLYEKEGDSPSQYSCTAPLNDTNFGKYFPSNDIVLTDGHGGVQRTVWNDANKNGIVDEGELNKFDFFSKETFDFLVRSGYKTKFFYDWGCSTFDLYNLDKNRYWVTADMILSSGIAGLVIGTTEETGFPLDENAFFNTLITSHRPIGEFLYNSIFPRPNAYQTEVLILGDPSFSLFGDSLMICADVTPPTVQISSPSDGSITNKPEVTISGTVSDVDSGIKKVDINSNPATLTDGSFNTVVKLEEGKNTVTVKAVDKADNETTITLNIIRDTTVPQILIVSPANNSTVDKESISVSGSVIDENIDTVTINGKTVSLDSNNKFFDTIQLQEGKNTITITAVDKVGNKNSQTVTIYYKKSQLAIIIILQIGKSNFTVNGNLQTLDSPPVIKNSRTLLPIRAIIESLGGAVSWDATERKVTVSLGSTTIELWIGKSIAKVNGIDTPIDSTNPKVVPEIINSRTMLPLRFVTENLGCDVQWDGTTKIITITYQAP
jgi:hypothetical protein